MTRVPYPQTHWSLSDLIPDAGPDKIDQLFSKIQADVAIFVETTRPLLTAGLSEDIFHKVIIEMEDITRRCYHLYGYASLSFSANTQDQAAQTLYARIQQFIAEIQNQTLFFELWWKKLDEPDAERLMQSAGDYCYWLEEMRNFRKHTLSEPEEKVINIKDVTGVSAIRRLYDSITNRYTFKLIINGDEKEITRGELMVYVRQVDPLIRAQAYQELYRVFSNDAPILGQLYQTIVRDWRNENIQLRQFSSPISVRNLINNVPDDVVDMLLGVCQKNSHIFQRYFRLKAQQIGMERLRRYDIYAPVAHSEKQYPFEQAVEMVLDSFGEFDPHLAGLAQRVFDQNHLDSEIRKGKRNGAFCSSVDPDITPWVLLNYQSRADDVATMAHELGHAIHSMLASRHSLFTFHPSLPLAETASTFSEMLLVDRLLQEECDENVRRDILFRQVDDAYATIQRQAFFALFEKKAHEMIGNNASVDDLTNAYQQNLLAQFGDSVEISDEFRYEWVSIPHIYSTPFYVYAYSFGQLLVLSLYQQYKREGEGFKSRYRKILSTGGSQSPKTILSQAGINMHDEGFWQGGFDVISGLVNQLELSTEK